MEKLVLEPSTNTHVLQGGNIKSENLGDGIISLTIEGNAYITHNEHHTIATEAKYVVKDLQQEYNPITQMLQSAYD
jgi:hypothetical protein